MIEQEIKKALHYKFQELNFTSKEKIDCINLFENFYVDSVDLSYRKLSEINLTDAQKKVITSQTITKEQLKEITQNIESIKKEEGFFNNLAIITRNRIAILRVFARLSKDKEISVLLSRGLELNKAIGDIEKYYESRN